MKILIKNQDRTSEIQDHIVRHRQTLQDHGQIVLCTTDYYSHVGAYLAWLDTPGKIFIKSPLLSLQDQIKYDQQIGNYDAVDDGLFMHTSGTTGMPKIIQHGRQQLHIIEKMSQHVFDWDKKTKLLCMFPASSSGFWHIVLPNLCTTGFEVSIGDRERLVHDLQNQKFDVSLSSPHFADFLHTTGAKFDFSDFRMMLIGASQVLPRHIDFLFNHGARRVAQLYGQTETGAPLLGRSFTRNEESPHFLDLNLTVTGVECRVVNQELWVRSPSNCANYKQFDHSDDWLRTGDLWEQHDNLIKFVGRRDDLRKINGYFANLLDIENWFEEVAGLGECCVYVRNISGTEYIELIHTKPMLQAKIDLQRQATEVFARSCVPVKYSQVETIPRTAAGKKIRRIDRIDS